MPEPPDDSLEPIDRLRAIVRILRGPGGCPSDIEQTQKSLIPNILEEAYEAADAIRSGDKNNVLEELGDLLLQVVMQSEIASESGDFFLEDVANAISDKLIRRHPHVFGNDEINDTIRMGLPVYGVSRQQQYPYEEYFWKNKNKI